MSTSRLVAAAGALVLALLGPSGCAQGSAVVTVDPAVRHQVMRGWEVTTDMTSDRPDLTPLYVDEFYDTVINDVGINRVRLEVRSGAENTNQAWTKLMTGQVDDKRWGQLRYPTVNDNDDPRVINWAAFDFSELDYRYETMVAPLRQRMEKRGERLFVNICYVAFTGQIKEGMGTYGHGDPEEYAEFVLATYLHLKQKYNFTPDAWEVLLEPDNGQKEWNPEVMGKAIAAAAKRLTENGFTPAFIAPSTVDMSRAITWIEEIAKVPGAMDAIVEFSYHRYENASLERVQRIAALGQQYGKPTGMLEWWFRNGTHEVLREDIVDGQNSAWQGEVLGGLLDTDFSDASKPRLKMTDQTRINLQYFRYIRLGAQRIGATSSGGGAEPTAYINPDGGYVVVTNTEGAMDLTIRGLPAGQYRISYALPDRSVAEPHPVATGPDGGLTVRAPGRAVVTVATAR